MMVLHFSLRIALGTLLSLAVVTVAFGQCPTGVAPCKAPSSTGAVVWVVVSVAVGVVTVYLLHKSKGESRNQPSFVGCTELTENGTVLTDEKDAQRYIILPGAVTLKPSERVEVLGTKDEDSVGRLAINVGKLVKDYGLCKSRKPIELPK